MVTWILIAAVVAGLIILVAVSLPVVGRLSGLRRAALRLQRRQDEAMRLQEAAQVLEQSLQGLQRRIETTQERLAVIEARPGAQVAGRLIRAGVRRSCRVAGNFTDASQTHRT